MSLQKGEKERKRKHWIKHVLWELALLLGLKEEARIYSYRSEIEEEIDRKRRLERNKSELEREHDVAK